LLLSAAETSEDPDTHRRRLKSSLIPSFLKLVAIATIADSVPLEGENRVIAAVGLRELRNPVQPGLRALMQVAQIPSHRAPTATEVGFRLAPRINAAGRMDIAGDVVELFLTKDQSRATELAEKLNRLNDERRATEAKALEAIEAQLARSSGTSADLLAECIILDDPNWHRGVLGILASRVVDRTGRPALVLTHEDGHAHGSGRSIEGFHLLDALTAVHGEIRAPNALFTRFGGHAHAVGFSMPSDRMAVLRERMQLYGSSRLTETILTPPLHCDAEILLDGLTPDFFDWLKRCEPFGIGNREPIFVTRGLTLTAPVRLIKEKHVCLQLEKAGEALYFSALGWSRATDWPARCTEIALGKGSLIDVAYRLKTNSYSQFAGLELELVDIRTA
jgi:single-stranded-DNA-specific exonuclease